MLASMTPLLQHYNDRGQISSLRLEGNGQSEMPNQVSIFEQPWWYEAASDGNWQHVEYHDGSNLAAKLIFVTQRRRGIVTVAMPPLARVMQPILRYGSGRPKDELYCNVKALKGLSDRLPAHHQFCYCLPPESKLELAFCLAGYTITPSYTFRTDPSGAHDAWAEMDIKVRSNITRGAKRMGIEVHDDVQRYIRLSADFVKRRAFNDSIDYDAVLRIWHACDTRKQASVLSCVDGSGQDLASAIVLWDDRHLYYWLSCRHAESNNNVASSVLIWNAVKIATQAGLVFDIDGYATPSAGIFKSRFGLLPHRRIDVSMTSSATRLRAAVSSHVVEMVGPALRRRLLTVRNAIRPAKAHSALPDLRLHG